MSYAFGAALQGAVFQALSADAALGLLVGDAIFDALPAGPLPDLYVSLGAETVRDRSDKTGAGAVHDFVVSVIGSDAGFQDVKEAATAVSDTLVDAALILSRGQLVSLRFLNARARRTGAGQKRRIDLRFRARISE